MARNWKEQELVLLRDCMVKQHNYLRVDWNQISQRIQTKTAKQCLIRWHNIEKFQVQWNQFDQQRRHWTAEEDQRLLFLAQERFRNWGSISADMGIKQNVVKNRFYYLQSKLAREDKVVSTENDLLFDLRQWLMNDRV